MPQPIPSPPLANADPSIPSLRKLGTGSTDAVAGNDPRITQLAAGDQPGWVSTTSQAFAGLKEFEDSVKIGSGIGDVDEGELLTVKGSIHSLVGGFTFPDGTTQTTAFAGGGGGGDITLGAVGSTPNSFGMALADGVLSLEPADGTHAGAVSAGAQTFGGDKTLLGALTTGGDIWRNTTGGNAVIKTQTSDGTGLAGLYALCDSGGLTLQAIGSAFGTNPATSIIRSSLNMAGGLQIHSGSNTTGISFYTGNGFAVDTYAGSIAAVTQNVDFVGTLVASNLSGANSGDVTLGAFGSTPNSNGASLSGQVLTLQPADGTHAGAVSTGFQNWAGNKNFLGSIGLGTTSPQQLIHMVSSSDSALRIQKTGITGEGAGVDPGFDIGFVRLAGVDLPELQIRFFDSVNTGGRKIFGLESSSTLATVANNTRGSSFENFIVDGGFHPWFRLNSYPDGRLQIGSGIAYAPVASVTRTSGVVTVVVPAMHHFRNTAPMTFYPGESHFPSLGDNPSDWLPVTVIDDFTFSFVQAGIDATSTAVQFFSCDVDVEYARDNGIASINSTLEVRVRIGGGDKIHFQGDRVLLESGIAILGIGSLQLGADGIAPVEILSSQFHLKPGYEILNEGRIRSTGWFNAGGQTQTTQRTFIVGGTGDGTTFLPSVSAHWLEYLIINRRSGNLTVTPDGTDTINGASTLVIPAGSACWVITNDVNADWSVVYAPTPP